MYDLKYEYEGILRCPLCGGAIDSNSGIGCKEIVDTSFDLNTFFCKKNTAGFRLHDSLSRRGSKEEINKRLNIIYLFLKNKPKTKDSEYWVFYYNQEPLDRGKTWINVFELMLNYPNTKTEMLKAIMLNIYKFTDSSKGEVSLDSIISSGSLRLFYPITNDFGDSFLLSKGFNNYNINLLKDIGLIKILGSGSSEKLSITPKGWEYIEKHENESSKNIFIAISFNENTKERRAAIKEAIVKSGYTPICLDDYDHNNFIVDEIFFLIKQCAAVVVDVTDQNNGAYFEAGYALGQKKPVIVLCDDNIFNDPSKKPHFDIAQINTIVFKNYEDLKTKLARRIEATLK